MAVDRRVNAGDFYPGGKVIATRPVAKGGDVRHSEFASIEDVPEHFTDTTMRDKLNEVIGALRGTSAAVALFFALAASGAGVTVQTAQKGQVYNDEQIVTNVTWSADGLATEELVETAVALAVESAKRTTAVAAQASTNYTDAVASGKLDISGGTLTGGLRVPNLTVGLRFGSIGENSTAEGDSVTASGVRSHAEGFESTASGVDSHAEGDGATASGQASHAEGSYTTASGRHSHAEGVSTVASGDIGSHAEGYLSEAIGDESHAEGIGTAARGMGSHTEGDGTIANNHAEHAQGLWNLSHNVPNSGLGNSGNTLSSIGFGTSSNRKNAVETMQDGKTFFHGLGGYDGTNPTNSLDLVSVVNGKLDASNQVFYATCDTAANVNNKIVTIDSCAFSLNTGVIVVVNFKYGNAQPYPTLSVNNTGTNYITRFSNAPILAQTYVGAWEANQPMPLVYDGQYWVILRPTLGTSGTPGIVRLSEEVNGNTDRAVTPNAVKTAMSSLVKTPVYDGNTANHVVMTSENSGELSSWLAVNSGTVDLAHGPWTMPRKGVVYIRAQKTGSSVAQLRIGINGLPVRVDGGSVVADTSHQLTSFSVSQTSDIVVPVFLNAGDKLFIRVTSYALSKLDFSVFYTD